MLERCLEIIGNEFLSRNDKQLLRLCCKSIWNILPITTDEIDNHNLSCCMP